MKKFEKITALTSFVGILLFAVFLFGCQTEPVEDNILTADEYIEMYAKSASSDYVPQTDAEKFVMNLGFGWNLGNTFDATGKGLNAGVNTETYWGQPKTTKAMMEGLVASGIKTIRIPVSWHNHLSQTNYDIDSAWMNRVKTVVDWALEAGLYVIINIHHDDADSKDVKYGNGFYPNSAAAGESEKYLTRIWEQVSATFIDYDERLIFETMNEPRQKGTPHEWWFDSSCAECQDAAKTLNEYNQLCVNTIRASGGNNATKRYIMVQGLQASPDSALNGAFKLPEDLLNNHLILSVHMYTPYNFAMESPGVKVFSQSAINDLSGYFTRLSNKFVKNGVPVIIGEMGATNKNNLDDRAKWMSYFVQASKAKGMTACLWDNGNWRVSGDDYNEHYGYYNRTKQDWYFPILTEIAVKAAAKQTK